MSEIKVYPGWHKDGTLPLDNHSIFVYGANLDGRHGKGAAKVAYTKFGAVYGQYGFNGRSYGIPTKETPTVVLSPYEIMVNIAEFENFVRDNPDKQFFVTRVGCGLAGFSDHEIAPYFKDIPRCNFPIEWAEYCS